MGVGKDNGDDIARGFNNETVTANLILVIRVKIEGGPI